ncbi:MAG: crtN [Marmoricola sp.]|jgi:phytoene dehydrogenase-like protein|nr:crtN [Marmoricola sp.]
MARVVVIGGGFGGMASAARLAKLGHDVTLLEAAPQLGGALGYVEQDGFRWDAGPSSTLLPAVIRDLFRKSGRAVEKEIELVPVEPIQQHRFDDSARTRLDLPGGSRAAQLEAIETALGGGTGEQWVTYVDDFAEVWEALRVDWIERPYSAEHASKEAREILATRGSLLKYAAKAFKDDRLRKLALHRMSFEGHDPRNVPAWMGMMSYLEQNFGSWTVPGGMGSLAPVLTARLKTRGVDVHTSRPVEDLVLSEGRVAGVRTAAGDFDADHVVVAIDPRRVPALRRHVERTMPAIPPTICHIGLVGDAPELPQEVVLHGNPTLVLRTNGTAPAGAHAWTVMGGGRLSEDIVVALARGGINVRDLVEVRVDRTPKDLVTGWNGSPYGVLWQGRATVTERLGPRTPIANVYLAGAHANPGAGLPFVGLSAALVAQLIGPS